MTLVLIDSAMKTLFRFFAPVAIAAIAFSACNKEVDVEVPSDETVHISVTAQANDLLGSDGTRTYIDTYQDTPNYILWGTGEYMKLAVTAGESTTFAISAETSADAFNGHPQATFDFSITPGTAASYLYQGLYPASAAVESNNTDPASYKVNLRSTQNATATSYDPAAYIMVAKPTPFDAVQTQWMASYRRATALNKVTLKNLPEDIKRVLITAPSGVSLTGRRNINLASGESGNIYDGSESVEVKYATPLTHGSDMDIWFTSWEATIPVGAKLKIVAFSSTHTFTREITVANNPMTFEEGCLNKLSINMASAVQGNNTELEEGNYVILAKNGDSYYALKAAAEGTRMAYEDYSGSTDSYRGSDVLVWTVAKSDDIYTIANTGKYLGWSSGNTAAFNEPGNSWTDTNYAMDITWIESSSSWKVNVHSENTRILAKNASADYGFAFYTGSGYNTLLFVPATIDNRTPVTLSFAESAIDLTTANYDTFLGQDLTIAPNVTAVSEHITWSYVQNPTGVVDEFDEGALTLSGTAGTVTVTASFEGDNNYLPAEACYTITVLEALGWFETPLSDITTDDVFVMVANNAYALSSSGGSSTNPPAVAVTVSGIKLSGEISDDIKWNLTGNSTDGYTFLPDGTTTKLFCDTNATANANTNLRVGDGGDYDRYYFVLDANHLKTNDTYTARYIGINGTTDFRGYVGASTNSATFKFYKYVDPRSSAGMSWSATSATASWDTGNTVSGFTAPTLTPGNATGITYESTSTSVATVSSNGTVTIVGPGETNIKAIFAGNETYKPQTVFYTLTVTDNRETVATPTFNPAQGTVDAGTAVTISCTTSGAAIHYTVDGTEPTEESATYSSAITVNVSMDIKAIAVKNGYKNSTVATARYTVNGGGGTYSLTPNQASTGSNSTSYITTLTEFTYNGVSWKMNQWNPSTLQIKTNQSSAASEFRFYNTSAFSGRISKVVITFSALTVSDASKLMFLGGTSEVSATTGGTAGVWNSTAKTLTWTPAATDAFTYFAFYQNGKAASGTNYLASADAIVVTYD